MNQEEKTQYQEHWRGRHHHASSGILGGLILIVLGVFLFLAIQGVIGWERWWQYFLVGLGGVFILDCIIRYLDEGRFFYTGRLTTGVILIGVGSIFLAGVEILWPVIIIVAGLVILLSGVLRGR